MTLKNGSRVKLEESTASWGASLSEDSIGPLEAFGANSKIFEDSQPLHNGGPDGGAEDLNGVGSSQVMQCMAIVDVMANLPLKWLRELQNCERDLDEDGTRFEPNGAPVSVRKCPMMSGTLFALGEVLVPSLRFCRE